jgi:preprotein translocase subunit SecG
MLLGLLLALQIIVAVALVGVILLQRSEGGALGMGGGPSGFMTARGAGDLLTRTTAILGGAFFILSLVLTVVTGHSKGGSSVVDRLKVDALGAEALTNSQTGAPPPAALPVPAAPVDGAPQPTAPSVFEAPKPQVNVAPSAAAPAAARSAPPTSTADSGARSPAASVLGVQTAPTAPQPAR